MCADFQFKCYNSDTVKLKHTWFRIPCIGNTWTPCTEWTTGWDCPTEVCMHEILQKRELMLNFDNTDS